jgi:hypothetical protein
MALQFFERAIVRALGGIDAALQASEGVEPALEDMTKRVVVIDAVFLFLSFVGMKSPELGLDATQTAKLPIGVHERIDQETLERTVGLELPMVIGGERFEGSGIFAGDDLRFGVDAGLESVEAGYGLPLRRAGASRFLRIAAIRLDLAECRHVGL